MTDEQLNRIQGDKDKKSEIVPVEWQQIFDALPDLIAVIDLDHRIKKVNRAMADQLNVKPEDLVGKACYNLMHGTNVPPDFCPHSELITDMKYHSKEFHIEVLQGDYSVSVSPIFDDEGELKGSVHVAHDITERKRLGKLNRNLAAIVESATDAIIGKDLSGIITSWNPGAQKLYGYSKEEMLGKSISTLLPPNRADDLDIIMEMIIRGESIKNYDTQRLRKDGVLIDVSLYISPIFNSDLVIIGASTIAHDISQRKKMEDILKVSEKKYREIFNNANDMMSLNFIKDDGLPGNFIDVNRVGIERLGYSREEFMNMTPAEIIAPDQLYKMPENAKKIAKTGYAEYELVHVAKDGRRIPVEINNHIFQMNGKKVALAVSRDISERKGAEKALDKSENRYRTLFNNMLDGFAYSKMIFDEDNRPVDWIYQEANQAYESLTGIKNVVGKKVSETLPDIKNSNPELYEIYGRVALTGENEIFETYIKSINKWFNISVFSPEKEHFVVVFEDITQRKNSEIALKENEEKFREVFNNANDAMFLHKIKDNTPGNFIEVNDMAIKSLGYSKKELMEMSPKDIDSPKSIAKIPKIMETLIKDGKITFEAEQITKDGTHYPVEINSHIFNIRDEKYILSIARDISERKKAEELLKKSENKYRTIFENVQDVFYQTDENGDITEISPSIERYSGYKPSELIGKPADTFYLNPEDRISLLKEIVEKGEVSDYELLLKTKLNETLYVSTSAHALLDSDGKPVGVEGSLRDITERKDMEIKLKESLKEKEMLLKEIHHRVKNNLMIISSLLNLQSSYIKDEASQNIFRESQNRARSMALIHERLYQSTDLKKIDFGEYIQSLSNELFHTYVQNKDLIKLKVNVEDIYLDINTAIPLGLIVNELITNSLKYAFPNGKSGQINVDFHLKDQCYEFIIKDNGVGFPEDIDYKNTDSLGLQIVNSLTDQIDGVIDLYNENGTEFEIKFKELEYK